MIAISSRTGVKIMKAAANEVIRARRLKLGMSQKELAEKAGVSTNTVYNVEAGKSASLTSYKKICDALELKLSRVLK